MKTNIRKRKTNIVYWGMNMKSRKNGPDGHICRAGTEVQT